MVVKLIRREKPLTEDMGRTRKAVQAGFQQRRKTLHNSLSHGLHLTGAVVDEALKKCGIDPSLRAERLSPAQFVEVSKILPY